MSEEELQSNIEYYVESFLSVEYGKSGLQAAKDAYADMGLEEDGVSFIAFILEQEEDLAQLVIDEFITHAN